MLKMFVLALLVLSGATEMPTPDGFADPTPATGRSVILRA